MDLDFSEEAFQPRDPWRFHLPLPAETKVAASAGFSIDVGIAENPFVSQDVVHEELKLPEPGDFQYGALEDLSSLEQSEATHDDWKAEELVEPVEKSRDEFDHLWEDIVMDPPFGSESKWLSWEAFQKSGKVESPPAYLSEAGDAAFDIAVYLQERDSQLPEEISIIRNDIFLRSLFALGLGRSSTLFRYDEKRKLFEQMDCKHNVLGLSKQSVVSIIERLTNCGRLIRHLRDFVDRTYSSGKAYPAKVALANAIVTIIDALEMQLTTASRQIYSVLQLQAVFERPHRMLVEVYDLARAVRNALSNEDLASLVYKRCQHCDQEPDWLRSMMLQVLARVSQPWLELAEQWVGFKDDIGLQVGEQDCTFVHCEDVREKLKPEDSKVPQELQYTFQAEKLPLFMSTEDGQILFNLGRDLRILRTHHPDHPLAQTQVAVDNHISLQWQNSWEHVDRIAAKARDFEAALAHAVKEHQDGKASRRVLEFSTSTTVVSAVDTFDPFALEGDEPSATLPDELFTIITANLSSDGANTQDVLTDFSPPTAITPVLSFNPLLLAQQRVLNAVMMRLFCRSHHLRLHLDIQRNFHLFGHGVFVSQLTAALFNPEQSSTERQRGVMRSGNGMGLRLGSRATWPPASSELRLALMGILSDCYHASFARDAKRRLPSSRNHHDLPGSLSFAIRQLSEEDAERILNADSLHALDFLRLQYSPPSPLGAILTPASLDRYDTIFKFLLRLTRLLFVVSHLPGTFTSPCARLFRWQADAFVSTCCRYFFETGVKETWSIFVQYLDSIERRLKEEDEAGELGTRVHEGIEEMRRQHDLCLGRITFALLLRMRQQKAMKVLEDVLATVLQFSKLCHAEDGDAGLDMERVDDLHKAFNDNAKLFLEVCRGFVGKKGYGKFGGGDAWGGIGGRSASGEENTIERLVIALDFNGFYERRL